MSPLTTEQADQLREWRIKLGPAWNTIMDFADWLCVGCSHEEESQPETCPICALYVQMQHTQDGFHDVLPDLDDFLLRGPHPSTR